MQNRRVSIAAAFILAALFMSPAGAGDGRPKPDGIAFTSPGCDDCSWLRDVFLPALQDRIPDREILVLKANSDTLEGYQVLLDAEGTLDSAGDEFPVFLAGEHLYYGRAALEQAESELLRTFAAPARQSTVAVLYERHPAALSPLFPPETERPELDTGALPVINDHEPYRSARVLFFTTAGCRTCDRAHKRLRFALSRAPDGTRAVLLDTAEPRNRALQAAVGMRLGLAPDRTVATPMVTTGNGVLIGAEINENALHRLLAEAPVQPLWYDWDEENELNRGREAVLALGEGFTYATVIGAAVIDGVNPCAFAVMAFLVSCMTLSQQKSRNRALAYGTMFCLGVAACYFLIGLGLGSVVERLEALTGFRRALYFTMAGLCGIFAGGAAWDIARARRRGLTAMRFVTPRPVTLVVHRLIRSTTGRGLLLAGALGLGFLVSALELVCTGQTYLPVIAFINGTTGGTRALALLVIYNLAFIVPLALVMFAGVYGGNGLLNRFGRRYALLLRGCTGALTLALAGLMLFLGLRA